MINIIIIIIIIMQFCLALLEQADVATRVTDARVLFLPIDVLDSCDVCGVKRISLRRGPSASQKGYELHTSENLCVENKVRIVSISPGGAASGRLGHNLHFLVSRGEIFVFR